MLRSQISTIWQNVNKAANVIDVFLLRYMSNKMKHEAYTVNGALSFVSFNVLLIESRDPFNDSFCLSRCNPGLFNKVTARNH